MGNAFLALDRAITPTFIARRVTLRECVQDERFTKHVLGVDCVRRRHRLMVVLRGTTRDFVDGGETVVTAGSGIFVPAGASYASRAGDCDVIELEWDPGGLEDGRIPGPTRFGLAALARGRAEGLAERLRTAARPEPVTLALRELLEAIRSEGTSFLGPSQVDGGAHASEAPSDQALMGRMDDILSQLGTAPMLVDLEGSAARRTLTRRIRSLHERNALEGRGGGCWRGIRDTYRLVIASILVSHPEATAKRVAAVVGYGSAEALHHAFRRASLPSPVELGRLVRSS